MSEKLEVDFKIDSFAQYPMNRHEGLNQLDRTPKLIDNVRKLWSRDIEQLYPQLAAPLQEGEEAQT